MQPLSNFALKQLELLTNCFLFRTPSRVSEQICDRKITSKPFWKLKMDVDIAHDQDARAPISYKIRF